MRKKDSLSFRDIEYNIREGEDGISAGEIMRRILRLSSREVTRCKQFEDGVMVAGYDSDFEPVMIKTPLKTGDRLRVRIYENNDNSSEIVPSDVPVDIVYEDEDLIILNKPGDMVVHPSYAHYTDSLSNALAGYYERTAQRHVIRTIGRLDRETSGLIIFAKNRYCASLLSEQTGTMSKRKEYLAIVSGVMEQESGTIDAPIGQREGVRMIREVMADGRRAVTHYHVERQLADYALVRLRLDTGRTHQIRVHMAHFGHPLLGDNLYGKDISDNHGLTRAALHAELLEFTQPVTGKKLRFTAEIPDDMMKLL